MNKLEEAMKEVENGDYMSECDWLDHIKNHKPKWYESVYYSIIRFFKEVIIYAPKRIWFRLTKGFWPSEWYNFDYSIAKYAVPRIKYLRDNQQGFPVPGGALAVGVDDEKLDKEWREKLDKIVLAFELMESKDDWELDDTKDNYSKIEEGLELFKLHWRGLWD
jgi:hypothetical protein